MNNNNSLLSPAASPLLSTESVDLLDLILHLSPHGHEHPLHLSELPLYLTHRTVYLLSDLVTQETLAVGVFIWDKGVCVWGGGAWYIVAGILMGAVVWGVGVWRRCQLDTSLIVTLGILSKEVWIQVVVTVLSLLSLRLRSFLTMLRLECCTFPN